MKLLYFHNGSDLYGASRSFLRLNSRLINDDFTVKAVLPKKGPLYNALAEAGVEVEIMQPFPIIERAAFKRISGFIKLLFLTPVSVIKICRLIRSFKPDLIHSNLSVLFTPAIAARLKGVPHIWHIRESYAEFGLFWKVYRSFMLWGCDHVVAVSTPIAEQFPQVGDKVVVIHNGFPRGEFEGVTQERIQVFKKKHGLKDELLVGLVGRIKYLRKGQEYVVEAAAKLKNQYPQVRYLLIGSPFPGNEDHLERLRGLIAETGTESVVIYTGDEDDIKAAYGALDISVMASGLPEPFGGVVIESMAMELPVVGTNIGGTLEQVEDGMTGILIPPRNPEAMADALSKLLENSDLRIQMGKAGRTRFEALFEFEPFYSKIKDIYEEVSC